MTKFIPIGRVQGEDGKIAQVNTVYVNDGGDPDVLAEISGESTNATLTLTFKNLVRDQLTESELDQIINNITVTSSNVVTGTRLTKLWEKLWVKLNTAFAKISHTHSTDDIEDDAVTTDKVDNKAITQAKIADGAVGETQLAQSLRDSIFPATLIEPYGLEKIEIGVGGGPWLNLIASDGRKYKTLLEQYE